MSDLKRIYVCSDLHGQLKDEFQKDCEAENPGYYHDSSTCHKPLKQFVEVESLANILENKLGHYNLLLATITDDQLRIKYFEVRGELIEILALIKGK